MSNRDDFDALEILATAGKKSKTQRFTLGEKKKAIDRLTRRVPEVIVKVSGGGKTAGHVQQHVSYITRNGRLEALTSDGDKVSQKEEVQDLLAAWGLEMAKGAGKNKLAFNMVFSMPENTPPEKVLQAVQKLARDNFYGSRDYLMVLHEPDTDPSKTKSEKPHVHLLVNATGHDGQRLYIRKATLQQWRAEFAENLRELGVEANATPRSVRGNTLKPPSHAVHFAQKRGASTILSQKVNEAARDLNSVKEDLFPWEVAIVERRKKLIENLTKASDQLKEEGDQVLAAQVAQYRDSLPPVTTERRELKRGLLAELQKQRGLGKTLAPEHPVAHAQPRPGPTREGARPKSQIKDREFPRSTTKDQDNDPDR